MHKVDRIVDAPADVVWRILIDTREWPIWGPSVRAVEAPSHLIGPGMRGRIQTPVGLWLPFEVTRWEPEHVWAWRVAGVEATGHRVEALGPGRCRITFEIPRWAPFYGLVCDAALRESILGRHLYVVGRSPRRSGRAAQEAHLLYWTVI